jgi:hypothetical protein
MGLGFKDVKLPPLSKVNRWLRGNHDNPALCRQHPNYLGEYGYLPSFNLFYVSGAMSIDAAWRTEGQTWWREEELSYGQLDTAIQAYCAAKPKRVVSHECPAKAHDVLLYDLVGSYFAMKAACKDSRTCQALQVMLDNHQPEEWVFGHYHVNKQFKVPGYDTLFTCVAPMDTYVLDTGSEI